MDNYPDMDTELKSSFPKQTQFTSSLVSETLLPTLGLKARTLLNEKQLEKLQEIRKRHIKKTHQVRQFHWD